MVKKLIFFFAVVFSIYSFPQCNQKFINIGNLKLQSGSEILNCKIGYRTIGRLNSNKSNVVLVPTWFGGVSADLVNFIKSTDIVDTSKYFIICVDALGDGVSSSPSNSISQPSGTFPIFSIKDMVNSQYILLTKFLGIKHLYAVFGGSMGGMQTFQWMVSYPDFMDKALPYVGSTKLTSYGRMLFGSELDAIEQGRIGNESDSTIMKTVNEIQTMAVRTPAYYVKNVLPDSLKSYMTKANESMKKRFNSYDWASQIHAMLLHNISVDGSMQKAAQKVKAKVFIIVSLQDHVVNPAPALSFAKLLNAKVYKFR
jgi:homoserine acetyltransferase